MGRANESMAKWVDTEGSLEKCKRYEGGTGWYQEHRREVVQGKWMGQTANTSCMLRINLGKQITGSRTKRRSSTNINSFHHLFPPSALIIQKFISQGRFPRNLGTCFCIPESLFFSPVKWKLLSRVWLFVTPWTSPGQNTGVGSFSLCQGILPTQGSNPGLPHCRWILYQLSHKGIRLLFLNRVSDYYYFSKWWIFTACQWSLNPTLGTESPGMAARTRECGLPIEAMWSPCCRSHQTHGKRILCWSLQ